MAKPGRKRRTAPFLMLRFDILEHPNFHTLSPRAVKLLIDIAGQYRGTNNGDLCATYSVMKKRGWSSNDQIYKGLTELIERGWLIKSRQGSRPNIASLYAITWESIDDCDGKLEIAATKTALNTWRREPPKKSAQAFSDHRHTVHTTPPHGATGVKNVVSLHRHTVQYGEKT